MIYRVEFIKDGRHGKVEAVYVEAADTEEAGETGRKYGTVLSVEISRHKKIKLED